MEMENVRGRRSKVLGGAIAEIDRLMNDQRIDADDIISQLMMSSSAAAFHFPTNSAQSYLRRFVTLRFSTMHARIPFENFLHKAATSGRKHGLVFGWYGARQDSNPRSPV